MQIGKGKQGVIVSEYGPHEDPLGYIQPACDNPQWIMWFDKKGDAQIYTQREKNWGGSLEPSSPEGARSR